MVNEARIKPKVSHMPMAAGPLNIKVLYVEPVKVFQWGHTIHCKKFQTGEG